MKNQFFLITTTAILLTLTACSTTKHKARVEPKLVTQPFHYSKKTWFDTDKSTLHAMEKNTLRAASKAFMTAKAEGLVSAKNKIFVVGHTDSRASLAYNQKLSERRAMAVAHYLSSLGIPRTAIVTKGRGETQPVASNKTPAGMQKNRRAVLYMQGPAVRIVHD